MGGLFWLKLPLLALALNWMQQATSAGFRLHKCALFMEVQDTVRWASRLFTTQKICYVWLVTTKGTRLENRLYALFSNMEVTVLSMVPLSLEPGKLSKNWNSSGFFLPNPRKMLPKSRKKCTVDFFPSIRFILKRLVLNVPLKKLAKLYLNHVIFQQNWYFKV